MFYLPSQEERDALLAHLGVLIKTCGFEPLVCSHIRRCSDISERKIRIDRPELHGELFIDCKKPYTIHNEIHKILQIE